MRLHVKGSFRRDWKKLNNQALSNAVLERITQMEEAKITAQIPRFKKLKKYSFTYKSEIISGKRIYWMLCFLFKNEIYLVRLKPESYFKKYMK